MEVYTHNIDVGEDLAIVIEYLRRINDGDWGHRLDCEIGSNVVGQGLDYRYLDGIA